MYEYFENNILQTIPRLLYTKVMSKNMFSLDFTRHIGIIPQGTVDNILGPDRLAGQKALDPNHVDNQHFDCTIFV